MLAVIGAYVLFSRFGFNFSELAYQFSKIDWVYASFLIVPIAFLFSVPTWRLLREYRIWKILHQPFRIIDDPFIDVDLKEESYGHVVLENGNMVKRAATFASRSGVIVRKAAYPKMFPTFEITWDQISNIYFVEGQQYSEFGSDSIGMARVTLNFAEEFILVLPWRGGFKQHIPQHIAYETKNASD